MGIRAKAGVVDSIYNGANDENYYLTPPEFYLNRLSDTEAKKNDYKTRGVLDKNGIMQYTYASGIHNNMYFIESLGLIRQRFPIVPLNVEGSNVMKEIEAVKDIFMNPSKHREIFSEMIPSERNHKMYTIGYSNDMPEHELPPHTHVLEITTEHEARFKSGLLTAISSSVTHGHSHVFYANKAYPPSTEIFKLDRCDDWTICFDGHNLTQFRRIY